VNKLEPGFQQFIALQSLTDSTNLQGMTRELEKDVTKTAKSALQPPTQPPAAGSESDCCLPQSPYLSSLPQVKQVVNEHKMLKHWEKFIIPKLQDFVRSSLKQFEFDDFFEQIRQPLRKGDQTKATEIAYIICDQRLPTGVTLPEASHDWSTISIEDVRIGQKVLAKIAGKNGLPYSPFLSREKRLGNTMICGEVIAVEAKSSSVLLQYLNVDSA